MNLDELRSVQSKERQKDSLQNLRPSFYQEVGEYIANLEDERDRVAAQAEDPFSSPEVSRLTDEIETAKDVVEAIYERRMGKLVKQASLAAAGMAANDEGLTAEEADLFEDLVERIGSNKSRVLDVLEGLETDAGSETNAGSAVDADTQRPAGHPSDAAEPGRADSSQTAPETDPVTGKPLEESSPAESDDPADGPDDGPPTPPQEPPADADQSPADEPAPDAGGADSGGVTPADVMGSEGPELGDAGGPDEPNESSAATQPTAGQSSEPGTGEDSSGEGQESPDVDRVTVKITRDIGSILGVDDREYSLATDDIVTLPEQNAAPLLEQEAAESLE